MPVWRHEAEDMLEAHAEGYHDELPRQGCPACEDRDLSSYPAEPEKEVLILHSVTARKQRVTLPYSEVAMYCGLAGQTRWAVEEDIYMNGNEIPIPMRRGCYVIDANGNKHHMLKTEAGWDA